MPSDPCELTILMPCLNEAETIQSCIRLVWQEELNKLRAILAVPRVDGNGEALLVGGMDGVVPHIEKDAAGGAARLERQVGH
jgi:hypothetical protein